MRETDQYKPLFSEREGLRATPTGISVRHDAPRALREVLPQLMYGLGWEPSGLRQVVCQVLMVAPDRGNWSDYPNVADEIDYLLRTCDWYRVYDIAESLARELNQWSGERDRYEEQLNRLFSGNRMEARGHLAGVPRRRGIPGDTDDRRAGADRGGTQPSGGAPARSAERPLPTARARRRRKGHARDSGAGGNRA